MIIIYLKYRQYKLKNIEKFSEAINNFTVIKEIFEENNVIIKEDGGIQIQQNNGENLDLTLQNNVINLGQTYKFDLSNNTMECGSVKFDSSGNLNVKNNDSFNIDPSGNITIGDFIYDTQKVFRKKNNNIIIDPSNNIMEFRDFILQNDLRKKDNSLIFNVDMNGDININDFVYSDKKIKNNDKTIDIDSNNITFNDYNINLNNNFLNKSDNTVTNDADGNMKCGNYEYSVTDGSKIKINNVNYNINDKSISNNAVYIDPVTKKQYFYITKIVLKKTHTYDYNLKNGASAFNANIYSKSFFTGTCSLSYFLDHNHYNNLGLYPLHISGIKFKDNNNIDILPNNYITSTINIDSPATPTTTTTTPSYSDIPTSENLYYNLNTPYFDYIGSGSSIINLLTTVFFEHVYTFTFTLPKIVNTVYLGNRSTCCQNKLNYATLYIYGIDPISQSEKLLKTISINNFDKNTHYTVPTNFFINSTTRPQPLIINIQ